MKRIITLLMAAVMVIGTAGLASAVEFKTSGHMHIAMGASDNAPTYKDDERAVGFDKDRGEDNFYAAQRFRPKLTMTAEGVTAVFEAQQHQAYWGKEWPVGGNPDISVKVRQAYIDFKVPSTPVSLKVGYQQLNLPSIWGHPVFEARVGGVTATIPVTDQIAIAAFYARPADKLAQEAEYELLPGGTVEETPGYTARPQHNSTDMFGVLLPLDFGMVQATPYFVYAKIGVAAFDDVADKNTDWNDTLMVGGANVNVAITDALSVKFDGIFTNYDADKDFGETGDIGFGWMLAAAVDYEMPFGTPGAFAWYASGADKDGEKGLYSVATDGFGPTRLATAGSNTFGTDSWVTGNGVSTMGFGLQVADMSFIDSLKHTVRVAYIQGTSDKNEKKDGETVKRAGNMNMWTEKDSFITFDVDSTWSIYENLAAVVELGGILPDLSSATKKDIAGKRYADDDFAWNAQLTLRFSF